MPLIGQVVQFWEDGFGYPQAAIIVAASPSSDAVSLRILAAGGSGQDRIISGVTTVLDYCLSEWPLRPVIDRGSVVFKEAEAATVKGRWSEAIDADGMSGNMYRPGEIVPHDGTYQVCLPQEKPKA